MASLGSTLERLIMKYIDRDGNITIQDSRQDKLLRWMYTHALGRLVLKPLVMPCVSRLGGWFLGCRCSGFLIKPFVKSQNVDLVFMKNRILSLITTFYTPDQKQYRPIEGDE